MPTITFEPTGLTASVDGGTTVLDAAVQAGLAVHAPCGGIGRCGKCEVLIASGVAEPTPEERRLLRGRRSRGTASPVACIVDDCRVTLPESLLLVKHRIASEGVGREIKVEPNVEKISLRLAPPELGRSARRYGPRARCAPGPRVPAFDVDLLRELATLRTSKYHVTAVLFDHTLAALEAGDTWADLYDAAVDIGTTTVVLYLCHLGTGKVVAVAST